MPEPRDPDRAEMITIIFKGGGTVRIRTTAGELHRLQQVRQGKVRKPELVTLSEFGPNRRLVRIHTIRPDDIVDVAYDVPTS